MRRSPVVGIRGKMAVFGLFYGVAFFYMYGTICPSAPEETGPFDLLGVWRGMKITADGAGTNSETSQNKEVYAEKR